LKGKFFLLPVLLLLISSCRITHELKDDEKILVRNVINIDETKIEPKKLNFDPNDLYSILNQKPNKRFLGVFRFREYIHIKNYQKAKKPSFKYWLSKNFGKEPVFYDELAAERSVSQLQLFLNNQGYFNSQIENEVSFKKHKAQAIYAIKIAQPYQINQIEYQIPDTAISSIIINNKSKSLVKPGAIYNVNLLNDERYHITTLLRNHGYFYFTPDYVFFEVDSAFNNHSLNIYTNISNPKIPIKDYPDSLSESLHKKYFINRIAINTEFSPLRRDTTQLMAYRDTTSKDNRNRYIYYYRDKLKVFPKALRNQISFKPNELYTEKDQENTYRQLSGLPLYGYTNFSFTPTAVNDFSNNLAGYKLDALINLSRKPVHSFSVEAEGTTSGSTLGIAGNVVYQNLNIFKGAELLTLKATGGLEWQQGGPETLDVFSFINTIQAGAEARIDFPKFLIPFYSGQVSKSSRPRTSLMMGINYQKRPNYTRYITNASFGYNWKMGKYIYHSFVPVELNSVSIFPDSSFVRLLKDINDPRLTNQYTDHLILLSKYSFIFNNQERNLVKNFTYFRWGIESAGNFIYILNLITEPKINNKGETILWNIPISQYIRTDIDIRRYLTLDEDNTIVIRGLAGIGIPYKNSLVLPFEKGFYAGGANDMRGWKYRSLGPGAYRDTTKRYFEKMGDLILELNLEYRFPIYGFLKGAIFGDLGNIWLLTFSENYPGGLFKWKDLPNQIAFSSGAGLRFDFSYFIFRVDLAAPMRAPGYPIGEQWRIKTLKPKDIIWNFGIGYPF